MTIDIGYDFPFKTKPFQHQLDCFNISRDQELFAYFMEMGTGKSKIIIDTVAHLYDKGKIDAALIFANKGSYLNWIPQVKIHMPDHIKYWITHWDSAAKKELRDELDKLLVPMKLTLKIFVMNTESLAYPRSYQVAEKFALSYRCMIVGDESTQWKNVQAARTKAALKLGRFAKYKRIATGSPIANSPLDLYGQCSFLGFKCLGFSSYYAFRAHYANLIVMSCGQRSFKKVVGYKNLDELTDRLKTFAFIIYKKDCLDLPDKIYETYNVELSPEQKKMYEDLKKRSVAEIDGGGIIAPTIVLTKLLRLHQIVCGIAVDESTKRSTEIPSNRMQALLDILEETGGKVIIWANYRPNIQGIEKKLKELYGDDSTCSYYGDTTSDERKRAEELFQDTESPLRFFVGNSQTGGFGITLTAASTVVYFSNNYNPLYRQQSEDRCHRIGQKKSVTYIDLVCPKTVDEKIITALKDKKSLADLIVQSNWRDLF